MRYKSLTGKVIFCTLIFFMMLMAAAPASSYAAALVKVVINGQNMSFDVNPIIENNRTLVPFRGIGESLGASVNWDQKTKTITAYKDSSTVVLTVGSTTAYVNSKPVKLDAAPKIYNNRTLVPLRFFSEAFGASVAWDNSSRTVYIYTGEKLAKYIMGYYYSQSYDDFMKNYDKMSAAAVKWYTLDQYGNVTDNDTSRWIMTPQGYEDVLKFAKSQNVDMHMLLFESDSAKLKQVLSTRESRERLVKQIMTVVEREGYDGVNIDFEYLSSTDKDKFNEFIIGLSEALHAKGKSLNISLPVKTEKADWWPGYDYKTLGKYCDFVVLMAYDKNPSNPEPQAGIDWVEEVVDYAIARIPANKVVLGIGYFGYDWYNGKKAAVVPTRNGMTYVNAIDELQVKYGLKLSVDSKSGMSYGTYTDENGIVHQIWMENDSLVDTKAKLVIRKGLKGIAVWRLGYTTPSFWNTVTKNFIPAR